ncbi:HNH endonuclease signature motif containing protein [Nocardioides speluncae]|uniref:HNH endonuclease signature motif containing protein n=1 Tax=Nocardioides speluncae TaxID=2670337 RepID=UPI001F0BA7BD|nr:HNH endonuclease signature motif containing protein [Nocardioides speluncae]
MRTSEKADALLALARLETQLAALRLKVMAAADDVAEESGARDVAAWLAHESRENPTACRAEQHLALALDTRCTRLGTAVAEGAVNLAQAKVIARALGDLPDDLDPELLVRAEEHLVEAASEYRPDQLRVLGRRILDVIAPDVGEAEEAKQLAREEERAWETTSLTLTRRGDGTTRLTGVLPDAAATRLATYLDAFTSPRSRVVEQRAPATAASRPRSRGRDAGAVVETTAMPQHRARGQAFIALLEHLDPAKLPAHGGDATTVMVTINHDSLTKDLATAGLLGTDDKITAAQARRLACTAQILPVVLGGKSEILDLGRTRRLFSRAQHKAMRIRDTRCRGENCTIPATWTEAHHWKPWSKGGKTDLADGVLLCSHHHHRAHDARYSSERMPNGDIRFHRRT